MNKKITLWVVVPFFFFSCTNTNSGTTQRSAETTGNQTETAAGVSPSQKKKLQIAATIKDGILLLSYENKSQSISDDGNIISYYFSEDNHNLITELQVLSNLVVLKLYKWNDAENLFVADTTNLNTLGWKQYKKKHPEFDMDNAISTQVQFLRWDKDLVVLSFSAIATPGADWLKDTITLSY